MIKLTTNMQRTENGKQWLSILPAECVAALDAVDKLLDSSWSGNKCVPYKQDVLAPFHLIAPQDVKLLIICKEPYASNWMATGIPVEIRSSCKISQTPSGEYFTKLIQCYWKDVHRGNFMRCYYSSGILVLNASFTIMPTLDKRYKLSASHFPLWTKFMHPFVRFMNCHNVPILALGVEAKGLIRNIPVADIAYYCAFPKDYETSKEFLNTASSVIDKHVYIVSAASEEQEQNQGSTG